MFGLFKKQPHIIGVSCVFNCGREKCPKWLILEQTIKAENGEQKKVKVGRCCEVWSVLINLELKNSLEKYVGNRNKNRIIKL